MNTYKRILNETQAMINNMQGKSDNYKVIEKTTETLWKDEALKSRRKIGDLIRKNNELTMKVEKLEDKKHKADLFIKQIINCSMSEAWENQNKIALANHFNVDYNRLTCFWNNNLLYIQDYSKNNAEAYIEDLNYYKFHEKIFKYELGGAFINIAQLIKVIENE